MSESVAISNSPANETVLSKTFTPESFTTLPAKRSNPPLETATFVPSDTLMAHVNERPVVCNRKEKVPFCAPTIPVKPIKGEKESPFGNDPLTNEEIPMPGSTYGLPTMAVLAGQVDVTATTREEKVKDEKRTSINATTFIEQTRIAATLLNLVPFPNLGFQSKEKKVDVVLFRRATRNQESLFTFASLIL